MRKIPVTLLENFIVDIRKCTGILYFSVVWYYCFVYFVYFSLFSLSCFVGVLVWCRCSSVYSVSSMCVSDETCKTLCVKIMTTTALLWVHVRVCLHAESDDVHTTTLITLSLSSIVHMLYHSL